MPELSSFLSIDVAQLRQARVRAAFQRLRRQEAKEALDEVAPVRLRRARRVERDDVGHVAARPGGDPDAKVVRQGPD